MMSLKKTILILVSLLLSGFGFSQVRVSGVVLDENTRKPLSNVDVTLPEAGVFTTTNTDGSFYLGSPEDVTYIEASKEGYLYYDEDLTEKNNYDFVILMRVDPDNTNKAVELEGALITTQRKKYKNKKENPAWAILKELWARKRNNGLRMVPQYEYEEYEKLQFDLNNIDSAFMESWIFKDFEFIFEQLDTSSITGKAYLPAFINESVYKVYGMNNPRRERRDLIANKNSGFEDNEIVTQTLKNLYKEFDIYQNRLNFFNKNFVSPVARDGFSVYDYNLVDTVLLDGVECYQIKYFPKREEGLTFKGDVYISRGTYAVKEVSMQTTKSINVNFVKDIYVSLIYDVVNDSIFYPKRDYILLDMSLLTKKNKSKGMFAHRTVSYKDFDFEKPHDPVFYSDRNYDANLWGAFERSDDYWATARHERLSRDEVGIYETLDSLKQVPRFNRMVDFVTILGSGYINAWNSIDIGNLYSSFGYNDIEGIRLRAGARTYFTPNDMWRMQFYTAYGFKDHQFKYGAEARFMFNTYNRFQIGVGTKRDIEQLAVQLTDSEGIMTRTFASSSIITQGGTNDKLSHINKTNVYTSIDPWKNVTLRLDGNYQTTRSADPSKFRIDYIRDGNIEDNLIDVNLSLSLIARPGAKYSKYGIDRYEHSTLAPTILLRYTRGFEGIFNSEFDYDKLQFLYTQPILIGSIGRSDITFEAGKIFQGVPLSLLSVIPGNESYGRVPGTFTQLDYYEFVTDSYMTFTLDHHFNGFIFSRLPLIKKLKLREVGFFRAAWGDISDRSKNINRSGIQYVAPSGNIYYEYGFGVENIGIGNIRPFRIDFNWRGNYKDMPDIRKFGVTFGLQFTF